VFGDVALARAHARPMMVDAFLNNPTEGVAWVFASSKHPGLFLQRPFELMGGDTKHVMEEVPFGAFHAAIIHTLGCATPPPLAPRATARSAVPRPGAARLRHTAGGRPASASASASEQETGQQEKSEQDDCDFNVEH
jgi:hypothetical protein